MKSAARVYWVNRVLFRHQRGILVEHCRVARVTKCDRQRRFLSTCFVHHRQRPIGRVGDEDIVIVCTASRGIFNLHVKSRRAHEVYTGVDSDAPA